jgi:hypothetical protein
VPGIRQLPYFHHTQTQLFGRPVMISRTGYTGERGYEIFCKAADAPTIWDTILAEGKALEQSDVAFRDLTMMFKDNDEVLYRDACCHFTARGYDYIVDEVVDFIKKENTSGKYRTAAGSVRQ